jgi:hypothetical protein
MIFCLNKNGNEIHRETREMHMKVNLLQFWRSEDSTEYHLTIETDDEDDVEVVSEFQGTATELLEDWDENMGEFLHEVREETGEDKSVYAGLETKCDRREHEEPWDEALDLAG